MAADPAATLGTDAKTSLAKRVRDAHHKAHAGHGLHGILRDAGTGVWYLDCACGSPLTLTRAQLAPYWLS